MFEDHSLFVMSNFEDHSVFVMVEYPGVQAAKCAAGRPTDGEMLQFDCIVPQIPQKRGC